MKKVLLFFLFIIYINANEYIYKEIDKSSVIRDTSVVGLDIYPMTKVGPYKRTIFSKKLKNGDKAVSFTKQYLACMKASCPVERKFEIYNKFGKLKISKDFGDKRVLAIRDIDGGYRLYLDDDKLNRYIDYDVHYYEIDVDKDMKQINIDYSVDKFFISFIDDSYKEFIKNFKPIDYKKELFLHHNLIYYILQSNDIRKIKFLEKHFYKIDKDKLNSALESSIKSKESKYNIEVLNYLETKGLNILTESFVLHLIESNQNNILEYLINKRGVKISDYILIRSIVEKNRDMFDYLIRKGANMDLNCSATVLQKEINRKKRMVASLIILPKYEIDYYLRDIDLYNASLYIKKVKNRYEVFIIDNKSKKEHKYNFSKNVRKIIKKGSFRSTVGMAVSK